MQVTDILMKTADYGPVAAIAGFLIWANVRSYSAVCKRLNEVEDWQKNELVRLNERAIQALDRNTAILQKCKIAGK